MNPHRVCRKVLFFGSPHAGYEMWKGIRNSLPSGMRCRDESCCITYGSTSPSSGLLKLQRYSIRHLCSRERVRIFLTPRRNKARWDTSRHRTFGRVNEVIPEKFNLRTGLQHARFEVFTTVTMKNSVFWNFMPCGSSCHLDEGDAKFLRNISSYKSHTP
jgi:hypothetical protein